MQVVFGPNDLRPLIEAVVADMIDRYGDASTVSLSEADAADALGIDPGTLATLRRAGEIPAAQLGRGYVYRRADLVALIQKRTSS